MKYCTNCGNELKNGAEFCPKCGAKTGNKNAQVVNDNQPKSKMAAGLLGIFLGYLGIHNFYLGYTNKGVAQLLLTLVGWIACGIGPIVAWIWSLVEGIQILSGTINVDAQGNPLGE